MKVFSTLFTMLFGLSQLSASPTGTNPNGKTHLTNLSSFTITIEICESEVSIEWDAEYAEAFEALNKTLKMENSLQIADEAAIDENNETLEWGAEMDETYKVFSQRVEEMGATGLQINMEYVIDAPAPVVYQSLMNVEQWPTWMKEIEDAKVDWSNESGTAFTLHCNGKRFDGEVIVSQPAKMIAWRAHNGQEKILVSFNIIALENNKTKIVISRDVHVKNEKDASFASADEWVKALKAITEKSAIEVKDSVL